MTFLSAYELKAAFGLKRNEDWPSEGLPPIEVNGIRCWVKPLNKVPQLRAVCVCPKCGAVVPVGRMRLHDQQGHNPNGRNLEYLYQELAPVSWRAEYRVWREGLPADHFVLLSLVFRHDSTIHFQGVFVPTELRGKGYASKALRWVVNTFGNDYRIIGKVEPFGRPEASGLKFMQLCAWYKRHGFSISRSGLMTRARRKQHESKGRGQAQQPLGWNAEEEKVDQPRSPGLDMEQPNVSGTSP